MWLSSDSSVRRRFRPRSANNGNRPGFAAALMLKDLKLAKVAALTSGATTPLGGEAAQLYALLDVAWAKAFDAIGCVGASGSLLRRIPCSSPCRE